MSTIPLRGICNDAPVSSCGECDRPLVDGGACVSVFCEKVRAGRSDRWAKAPAVRPQNVSFGNAFSDFGDEEGQD